MKHEWSDFDVQTLRDNLRRQGCPPSTRDAWVLHDQLLAFANTNRWVEDEEYPQYEHIVWDGARELLLKTIKLADKYPVDQPPCDEKGQPFTPIWAGYKRRLQGLKEQYDHDWTATKEDQATLSFFQVALAQGCHEVLTALSEGYDYTYPMRDWAWK